MSIIYILLPVHNRIAITQKFIESLKKQTYTKYHLVLIDDGSIDGTKDMIRNEIPDSTILQGSGSWWWGGSLHQGYRWIKEQNFSKNDLVLIINDDTTFNEDFLEIGAKLLIDKTKIMIQAQAYSNETMQLIDNGTHVDWKKMSFTNAKNFNDINCLSTRGLFLNCNDFVSLGGFHPFLLPHYASDYEFTIRAYNRGYTLTTEPSLYLVMNESTTGLKEISIKGLLKKMKRIFSIRYIQNPLYRSNFLFLCCPKKHLIKNFLSVWYFFFKELMLKK
jgi:GT2 family glycosyltransferase